MSVLLHEYFIKNNAFLSWKLIWCGFKAFSTYVASTPRTWKVVLEKAKALNRK